MPSSFSIAALASTVSPFKYALYSRSYWPVALLGRLSKFPPSLFQLARVSIQPVTACTCFFRFA